MEGYDCISRKKIFNGKIIDVFEDTLQIPTGALVKRELIKHRGGVGILPIDQGGNYLFVKQYRYGIDEYLLEIPAGISDEGESPMSTASRELEEEIGYVATNIQFMTTMYPTPGYSSEKLEIFIGRDLVKTKQNLDEHEILEIMPIKQATAFQMVLNNEIKDAKTIIAILWDYQNRIQ